jgi:hypothetical protein
MNDDDEDDAEAAQEAAEQLLNDLIAAVVAARADGAAVLTVENVKARLARARLYVARVEDDDELPDVPRKRRRTQQSARDQRPHLCVVCGMNSVDAENGVTTCEECLATR